MLDRVRNKAIHVQAGTGPEGSRRMEFVSSALRTCRPYPLTKEDEGLMFVSIVM